MENFKKYKLKKYKLKVLKNRILFFFFVMVGKEMTE